MGIDLRPLRQFCTVARPLKLKQAIPVDLAVLCHLESWLSSDLSIVAGFSAGVLATVYGMMRLVHVIRSHPDGAPKNIGLFCVAVRGKAKDQGSSAPLHWTIPRFAINGHDLVGTLYSFLTKYELENKCIIPAAVVPRGKSLADATEIRPTAMSAEQIMRHIRAFLQQAPLCLSVLAALSFTSYSLRRVLSTLADRRGLPLGVRIAMGDWAEAPSDVLVGAQGLSSGIKHAVRYSETRLKTACETKLSCVLSLREAKIALDKDNKPLDWDSLDLFFRGQLSLKPSDIATGPLQAQLPEIEKWGTYSSSFPATTLTHDSATPAALEAEVLDLRPLKEKETPPSPTREDSPARSEASVSSRSQTSETAADIGGADWRTDISWFATETRIHIEDHADDTLPPGIRKSPGGCKVQEANIVHEGTGLESAGKVGIPWCGRCRNTAWKHIPDSSKEDFSP